jgi:conserved oligomeric Golgi complex subunit 5
MIEIPIQSSLASHPISAGSHTSSSPLGKQARATAASAAQAGASLTLLLREDPLLTELDMHIGGGGDEAAFSYAAAMLDAGGTQNHQQLAEEALGEVERKLTLVESLKERVSRTSPEAVAGSLLRLHGYTIIEEEGGEESAVPASAPSGPTTTLMATRERCERLKRQGEVLEGVASRVESSLERGLVRMDKATKRLSRVLQLSETLKMILRLQFEASKLEGLFLDDLRDLTRAAASVATIEDLLSKPELKDGPPISVVEAVKPLARKTGVAVRKAAADLLSRHQASTASSSSGILQLGSTLQVYFHLGELPQAAWNAVNHAIVAAEKATTDFWSPTTLANLNELAVTEAKLASGKKNDERAIKLKLKELRAEVAAKWARDIIDASLQVWNLHLVLCRKSDPVSRQLFVDVVAQAPIPEKYSLYLPPGQTKEDFSIFALYWERLCYKMGDRLKHILDYENGKFAPDVSGLYPAVRVASINMVASITDAMQVGVSSTALEDTVASSSNGILGGSAALNDTFLQWTTSIDASSTPTVSSADTWTAVKATAGETMDGYKSSGNTVSMSSVFNSTHWVSLQGNHASGKGLFRLQRAFLEDSRQRLCAPLQFMFQENVSMDDNGNVMSHLPLLPSRYDIQKLESIIRQELSLADPREGGGDLSAVTMISENVTGMISQFCEQAHNSISQGGGDACLDPKDGSPTEALLHNMKVAKIMNAMVLSMRAAPEKVFLAPYRPAVTPQLEEAASMCEQALKPGLLEIDRFVKAQILGPLCRALNARVARSIGRIHYGSYIQESSGADLDAEEPSFVQKNLSALYEGIGTVHLAGLPKSFAAAVASTVATFSIYTFVSNVSLMRPLAESTRLHLTQDLADFELLLEQLMAKGGEGKPLSEISNGKPYAELRAVRNMLFWTGLDDTTKPAATVAKTMLRESWARHVRSSTMFHYLFAFAPPVLSSPHHFRNMRVDEYVGTLVTLDGSVEEGEAGSWVTTLACCDSYLQRESAQQGSGEGDARIANILMTLGPELLRRQRN